MQLDIQRHYDDCDIEMARAVITGYNCPACYKPIDLIAWTDRVDDKMQHIGFGVPIGLCGCGCIVSISQHTYDDAMSIIAIKPTDENGRITTPFQSSLPEYWCRW